MRDCIVDGCEGKSEEGKFYITEMWPDGTSATKRCWFICRACIQSLSLSAEEAATHLEEIMVARAIKRELEQ